MKNQEKNSLTSRYSLLTIRHDASTKNRVVVIPNLRGYLTVALGEEALCSFACFWSLGLCNQFPAGGYRFSVRSVTDEQHAAIYMRLISSFLILAPLIETRCQCAPGTLRKT